MKDNQMQIIPNVLKCFARLLGTEVNNGKLEIPEKFGKGYCRGFVFNEHIRILILNYELNEDLVFENPDIDIPMKMIHFKFQNIINKKGTLTKGMQLNALPVVLIATRSMMNTDVAIPIQTKTATINIGVDPNYLNGLFNISKKSSILKSLLHNNQPLLFEQMIYPSLQKIVDEIVNEKIDDTFELFFLRIKAEELICRLLMELEKRDEKHLVAINIHDIHSIYKIKEQMLEHLEIPPVIKEMAVFANMSPTKLKRLFKQIFGNSIFSYYQEFRMKEASRLLKEENLTVSDVGYQMGFTNLSHFSKVFEKHIGMKPKQYSRS